MDVGDIRAQLEAAGLFVVLENGRPTVKVQEWVFIAPSKKTVERLQAEVDTHRNAFGGAPATAAAPITPENPRTIISKSQKSPDASATIDSLVRRLNVGEVHLVRADAITVDAKRTLLQCALDVPEQTVDHVIKVRDSEGAEAFKNACKRFSQLSLRSPHRGEDVAVAVILEAHRRYLARLEQHDVDTFALRAEIRLAWLAERRAS